MIVLRRFPLLIVVLALGGCAAIPDEPSRTAPAYSETPSATELPKPYYYISGADIDSYYGMSPEKKQEYRDKYIEKGVIYSTENYNAFKDRLYTDDKLGGLGLELATLGISGVGTFIEGTQTLQILHAIVAGLTGVKSAVDKRALLQQTVDTIVYKMDAQRANVQLRLFEGRGKSINDYPLIAAYGDMRALYEAGTIKGALGGLATDASKERAEAVAEVASYPFRLDEAATALRKVLCADAECQNFSQTGLTAVRQCQQSGRLSNVLLLDLVFKDEHKPNREMMVNCLKQNGVI